jgi:hypothetical protein
MRKAAVLLAVAALCSSALADPMEQGTYEVRGGLIYNIENTVQPLYLPVMGGFGYYLADSLQAGGLITFEKRKWQSAWGVGNVWGVGGFAEYTPLIGPDIPIMPSLTLMGRAMDSDNAGDVVFVGTLSPGVRLLIANVALTLNVDVNLASQEIYNFDREWVVNDITYPDSISGTGSRVGYSVEAGVRVLY